MYPCEANYQSQFSEQVGTSLCSYERAGRNEEKADRPLWTRRPIATSSLPDQPQIDPPEINSADVYPVDEYKNLLPPSVDVFLPGKVCSNHGTSLTSTDDHYFPFWCIMKRLLGTR